MIHKDKLNKLNLAITRMELRGHQDTGGYRNLVSYRDRILQGEDLNFVDVTYESIASLAIGLRNSQMLFNKDPLKTTRELSEKKKQYVKYGDYSWITPERKITVDNRNAKKAISRLRPFIYI